MLTKEQLYFLRVLSDYLARRASEVPDGLEWSTLLSYGEEHQLSGILYSQCKRFVPGGQRAGLQRKYGAEVFFYANKVAEYARISAALRQSGLRFALIKGLKIAKYYPEPSNRTMGDFDLLIDAGQIEEIKAVFARLGYTQEKDTTLEWSFRMSQYFVELHEYLLGPQVPEFEAARPLFLSPWEHMRQVEGTEYELEWNYHFVYLIQHIRQHLMGEGVGFRQFFDLAVIIRGSELDWEYITDSCKRAGLYRLLMVCLSFLHRWFELDCPTLPDLDEAFYEEATEKLFADGVFGSSNEANTVSMVYAAARSSKEPLPLVKLKTAARLLFPSYRSVVGTEGYGFLQNRPWLLPLAWLLRALHALTESGNRGLRLLRATVRADSQTIRERDDALDKWGV